VQVYRNGTVNLGPIRQSWCWPRGQVSLHQSARAAPVASRQVEKAQSWAARYSLAERQ
jgi:hypothetical protein